IDRTVDQMPSLKAHRQRMVEMEDILKERYKAGTLAVQDVAQTTYARLEAELWLEQAEFGEKCSDKQNKLRTAMLKAAETEVEARPKEFVAGRGTLDIQLGANKRLLLAQQALSGNKAARLAALEAYRKRQAAIEALNRQRYQAGRIALQDFAESQYYR